MKTVKVPEEQIIEYLFMQDECEHLNRIYQPREYFYTDVGVGIKADISVHESYTCEDCGKELDIPEEIEGEYKESTID